MKVNAINITKKIEKTIPLYEHFEEIYSDQSKFQKCYDICETHKSENALPQLQYHD